MNFLQAYLYIVAVIISQLLETENVFGFAVIPKSLFSPMGLLDDKQYHHYKEHSSTRITFEMSMIANQPFNPFSQRQKNNKVRWFEADLDAFYAFVENQPLLTAEQELQYGKAMRMWVQVEQMRNHMQLNNTTGLAVPVSDAEIANIIGCSEAIIGNMSRYAEVSKTRLVNSNLKLVLAVVSRYRTAGIPNAELIAEGTRGLSKAALRYDYSKGFRFATYATWYVHQAIADYVRWRKHPAKMPSRYLLLQRKVKDFSSEFKILNGRHPTVSEISYSLSQKQYDIIKVLTMQTYPTLSGSTARSAKSKIETNKERTFEELIPSLHKAPLAQTDSKGLRRDMEKMMNTNLNDVERDVLRLRLGLDDGRVKAVKEVGKRFQISWKQVRSVEKEALSKLLSSEEISEFVDSYNSP
jgi:RNA polymerase primary sigma factor|mmetsp:Transcript_17238/g.16569  ORF Transcript_17238/g.16569 Transcript_17238/m.16569 type:complete len:411 (-) Transcript_17238:238-1470(-)